MNIFKQIQKILADENLDFVTIAQTPKDAYDQLSIFLGTDYQDRERTLEITLVEQQLINPKIDLAKETVTYDNYTMHFTLAFPFDSKDYAVPDTARLVAFLNRTKLSS